MTRCLLLRDARVPIGGFERWTETLAEGLPRFGVDVELLVVGANIEPRDDDAQQAMAILEACRDRARAGEHGVFLTLGYHYLSIVSINLLRSPFLPIPVVHGTHPGIVEWLAVGPPRRVVAVSPPFAETIRNELAKRVGGLRGRVDVIENGVALPPPRARVATPAYRVVAVTRLDEDMKRPFDYVAIARRIREEQLPFTMTLIGGGPAEAVVRETARDALDVRGAVPRDEVYRELLASDVFVIASEAEASSLAVIEALGAGCAVIASERSINAEVVRAGAAVAVRTGDIDAFVAELRALTPQRIAELGARARRYAEEHYAADAMLRRYAQLIERVGRHAKPNRQWEPPRFLTPADALPETFAARLANRVRGIVERFTT